MTLEEKIQSLRSEADDLDCWAGRGGGNSVREYAQFLENVNAALPTNPSTASDGETYRACLQISDAVRAVTTDGES